MRNEIKRIVIKLTDIERDIDAFYEGAAFRPFDLSDDEIRDSISHLSEAIRKVKRAVDPGAVYGYR